MDPSDVTPQSKDLIYSSAQLLMMWDCSIKGGDIKTDKGGMTLSFAKNLARVIEHEGDSCDIYVTPAGYTVKRHHPKGG